MFSHLKRSSSLGGIRTQDSGDTGGAGFGGGGGAQAFAGIASAPAALTVGGVGTMGEATFFGVTSWASSVDTNNSLLTEGLGGFGAEHLKAAARWLKVGLMVSSSDLHGPLA